ncbi:hypothetical protein AMS68_006272 [Peltaster fructicola]|uniref:non-specific serine/threonine protein kinase n=1 Tax=Peltaster fructicola TaxID=286661 RepID=A0A6H0Y1G7_9PEZI|nr:hypothetical protein AMS68_006272 [Peltaster fructicola]
MAAAFDDEDLSIPISSQTTARRSSRDNREGPTSAVAPSSRATPKPSTPRSAQRLGQYNVVKTLGEGSFGKVKLAIHQVSGQQVALKIISRRKLITRDMAGRIEREIQYLQLLRHPHIIKLFTVITTPSEIVMVLEYAGGELFDYIVQNGKMPEDKARKFFQQIVCAVEYCHRHKIVHRDLKPENLLLDENLNVKIADFGLSNIMTDGNFLKTSCGSPNYAAPEVISGKLYAGPEVDVWSCGVILYVLLVGRLPFDDEYIPALFRKIAQGSYTVPPYLSQGAVRLIRKILQVNPMNRITIQEIRQDPWFVKDLPQYLQPPVEEFLDTGVDPNKAIDPHALSKGKPAVIQEKLHESVVGKLGKTMGYAPNDVQEALAKDEPSAIKDAYLIVRENQLMKNNPSLAADQPAFMAQSPPPFAGDLTMSPRSPMPMPKRIVPSPLGIEHPRQSSQASISAEPKSPATTIAILPSSLPEYHAAYMKGQINKSASPTHLDEAKPEPDRPRTKEEQEAMARRLKPHSKSSTNLHRNAEKPEPMTSMPEKSSKKPRVTKWQFGIRSRNSPAEAMLAIYKALMRMNAQWEVPRAKEPGAGSSGNSPDREREDSQSPEYSDSDPNAGTDPEYASHSNQERRRRQRRERDRRGDERRGRERFGRWNDYGYSVPEDPWVINARFIKAGMRPSGANTTTSTNSSGIDLASEEKHKRKSTQPRQESSTGNVAATGPASRGLSKASHPSKPVDESVYVYVAIQLYSIEKDFYLVDFKCSGYEKLVRRFASEVNGGKAVDVVKHVEDAADMPDDASIVEGEDGHEYMGEGRVADEKDITSPYPFLDVASRLIIALAEAND